MVENSIDLLLVLSPQEEMFAGFVPSRQYNRRTWYTPNGITDGLFTVEQVVKSRNERAYVLASGAKVVFGNEIVGFNLPPLRRSGRTQRDPVLQDGYIETLRAGGRRIIGRDRTVMWEAVHGGKGSLHLRRASMNKYYPLQGKRRI